MYGWLYLMCGFGRRLVVLAFFLFLCEFLCGCVGVFLVFVYVSLVRLYVGGIWLSL